MHRRNNNSIVYILMLHDDAIIDSAVLLSLWCFPLYYYLYNNLKGWRFVKALDDKNDGLGICYFFTQKSYT